MTNRKTVSFLASVGALLGVMPTELAGKVVPRREPKPAAPRDALRDKEVRDHNSKVDLHQRQAIRRRVRKATKQQLKREGFLKLATGRKQFQRWVQHRTSKVFALVKPPRPEEVQPASIAGLTS